MRLTWVGIVPAVVLVLLAGLTGCVRHGGLDGSAQAGNNPVTTVSGTAAAATAASSNAGAQATAVPSSAARAGSLHGIAQDLAGVDGAVSQSGSDASAGDSAARQGDAP